MPPRPRPAHAREYILASSPPIRLKGVALIIFWVVIVFLDSWDILPTFLRLIILFYPPSFSFFSVIYN
jgi:hypothetical protein